MMLGGFPGYVISGATQGISQSELTMRIRSDIDSILGEAVLPDERFDFAIAQTMLSTLLCNPGGILNVKKIADATMRNERTVTSYLSKFERRFLVRRLANLKTAARRQTLARAKIHPVDTALSCAALDMSGQKIEADPTLYGQVFESFVVNEVVAAAQWALRAPSCFYWRDPAGNTSEVDLVLESGNELVGIEVKAAERIGSHDFSGLRALAKDSRFKRGFVVYTGSRFVKETDNLWGMPVCALWHDDAFEPIVGHSAGGRLLTVDIPALH